MRADRPSIQQTASGTTFDSDQQIANSAERFCCKELDFGSGVVWLHRACGVHLDPLEINGYSSDCLAHLDHITSAVLRLLWESAPEEEDMLPTVNSE